MPKPQHDWLASATFTAYGKLDNDDLLYEDGGDCLGFQAGNANYKLAFFSEQHLDNFLEAYKILCGHSKPQMRMTGVLSLGDYTLIPTTLRRTDTALTALMFRMRLDLAEQLDLGDRTIFAENLLGQEWDELVMLNKHIINRLLHQKIKINKSSVECCGIVKNTIIEGAKKCHYNCRAIRNVSRAGAISSSIQAKQYNAKRNTKSKRAVSLSMRLTVLARDNYKCVKCGASPQNAKLHIDHVIPFSRGGNCALSNLQTLCEKCNLGKGNRLEIELIP